MFNLTEEWEIDVEVNNELGNNYHTPYWNSTGTRETLERVKGLE